MATKKEPAAQAVENAVETVEKIEAKAEEKDDGMVTIHLFKDDDRYSAPVSWASTATATSSSVAWT